MSDRKAIHYGAGNIGRGFIGPLLVQSGYHVTFADIDKTLIDNINELGEYSVHILEPKKSRPTTISGISGVMSNTEHIITEISDPRVDIITTSVGVGVLPRIAGTLAKGLSERRKAGHGPVNIIACENAIGASAQLEKSVHQHLSDEDKEYAKHSVGFANCAVDRIVPPFKHPAVLDVGVEGFYEWIVEKPAMKNLHENGTLNITGMHLTDDLSRFVERKLFTLNTGHAITAYLGVLHGYTTIHDSIQDPSIRDIVHGAMLESGAALLHKHPAFTPDEQHDYIHKIEDRFRNSHISDDVNRVGRDPLRKLSRSDRLLGPAYMARDYGLPIDNLARGIAAAFLYQNEQDTQAVQLQEKISTVGVETSIAELTGFERDTTEFRKVLQSYHDLQLRNSKL